MRELVSGEIEFVSGGSVQKMGWPYSSNGAGGSSNGGGSNAGAKPVGATESPALVGGECVASVGLAVIAVGAIDLVSGGTAVPADVAIVAVVAPALAELACAHAAAVS